MNDTRFVPRTTKQLPLALLPTFGWGGARTGAGRKPRGGVAGLTHAPRPDLDRDAPVHVTLRARPHVWNLRTRRCQAVIAAALRGVLGRPGFAVVQFSIQGNHLHLVVEAADAGALTNGMRALAGRISIGLNRLMGRHGRVFTDRYHAHVLRTPGEVRHAVAYVLGNFASHAQRRGHHVPGGWVDPYSSAAAIGPDGLPPPVSVPRSWLLGTGSAACEHPRRTMITRRPDGCGESERTCVDSSR